MIHPSVKIGKYCIIDESAMIGENTIIKDFSTIGKNVKIGRDCIIGRYCEIRDHCKVGEGTSFGSRCTLSAGTIIGSHCVIKYSFVATDTKDLTNPGKKTTCIIGDNVLIGACVVLMPGVHVGDFAMIGAMSQVRHNVAPDKIVYGNPC